MSLSRKAKFFALSGSDVPVTFNDFSPLGEYTHDKPLREAIRTLMKATPQSLKWAFDNDEVVRSVSIMTTSALAEAIVLDVHADDEEVRREVKRRLDLFLKFLNVTEFMETIVSSLYTYGNALFHLRKEVYAGIPMYRPVYLDWRKVKVSVHPYTGWLRYEYVVNVAPESEYPKNRDAWIKEGENPPEWRRSEEERRYSFGEDEVIHFKILAHGSPTGSSPIAPVLYLIVYKKLTFQYMMGSIQVYGSPIYVATINVGEGVLTPENEELIEFLQERMEELASLLQEVRYNNNIVMPSDTSLEIIQPSRNFTQDFREAIELLDKKIFLALVSSPYLVEARGTELATSRTILQVWKEWIGYLRSKIEDVLERDLFPKLIELWGFDSSQVWVDVRWTEERPYTVSDFVAMVRHLDLDPRIALKNLGFDVEEMFEHIPAGEETGEQGG